jgi:hypothetical protein
MRDGGADAVGEYALLGKKIPESNVEKYLMFVCHDMYEKFRLIFRGKLVKVFKKNNEDTLLTSLTQRGVLL